MKKIFISLSIVSIFFLASCKKDYTCTCVYTNSDGSAGYTEVDTYTKVKKSDARANCLNVNSTSSYDAGVTTSASCTLK